LSGVAASEASSRVAESRLGRAARPERGEQGEQREPGGALGEPPAPRQAGAREDQGEEEPEVRQVGVAIGARLLADLDEPEHRDERAEVPEAADRRGCRQRPASRQRGERGGGEGRERDRERRARLAAG